MRRLIATLFAVVLATQAAAQDNAGLFKDYDELKATMDNLVGKREISRLMVAFGGADEMTPEQLSGLESRVRAIFPLDFVNVTLIKREQMEGGWWHEMWAYYIGSKYLYTYVLIHVRPEGALAVNFQFNTDFDNIYANF